MPYRDECCVDFGVLDGFETIQREEEGPGVRVRCRGWHPDELLHLVVVTSVSCRRPSAAATAIFRRV